MIFSELIPVITLQAAPVPTDWNPLILASVPLLGGIALWMRSIVQRQDKLYIDTIASNAQLQTSLNTANTNNATLGATNRDLQTKVDSLERRADKADEELISLRKASDDERIAYRKEIDSRDQTIEALKATIDLQNSQIADLQSQGKVFAEQVQTLTDQLSRVIEERDQLQRDKVNDALNPPESEAIP